MADHVESGRVLGLLGPSDQHVIKVTVARGNTWGRQHVTKGNNNGPNLQVVTESCMEEVEAPKGPQGVRIVPREGHQAIPTSGL